MLEMSVALSWSHSLPGARMLSLHRRIIWLVILLNRVVMRCGVP